MKKYNFQGQSARSICLFDLYHERLEEYLWICEPDFYENLYQKSMGSRDEKISIIFSLNWKCKNIRKIVFHPAVPVLKYHQKSSNSCYFSSLASDFHSIGEDRAATALSNHIKEYLKLQI